VQVKQGNGIEVSVGKKTILFDQKKISENAISFLSHAHSDHAKTNLFNTFIASPETIELTKIANKKQAVFQELKQKNKFKLDDTEISLLNAGHILGSSQLHISNGSRLTISSDFKLNDSLTCKKATVPETDLLVIESTFGKPEYSFPQPELVYDQIENWIKENSKQNKKSILIGYSLGKAQELTKLVTSRFKENLFVSERIYEFNKAYEKLGCNLGDYSKLTQSNFKEAEIMILPPHFSNRSFLSALNLTSAKKYDIAMATGWPKSFVGMPTFCLSDHADFNQIMSYVEQAKPKMVLTMHGFENELARSIKKKLNIEAKPLGQASSNQKNLMEFAFA